MFNDLWIMATVVNNDEEVYHRDVKALHLNCRHISAHMSWLYRLGTPQFVFFSCCFNFQNCRLTQRSYSWLSPITSPSYILSSYLKLSHVCWLNRLNPYHSRKKNDVPTIAIYIYIMLSQFFAHYIPFVFAWYLRYIHTITISVTSSTKGTNCVNDIPWRPHSRI